MAERRMFSGKIVCSDSFTDMPFSAQALYFQLSMEADDDGFLNRAKRIQGAIGATDADLELLIEKRFILRFKNGVMVIKHWRMNNQIRKDRYTPTQYQDEFNSLEIRKDGAYTEKDKEESAVDSLATTWQPDGNQMATQYRLGKDSIGKFSVGEESMPVSDETEPPAPEQKVTCQQVVELYNAICKSFPAVRAISENRKKAIKARLNAYTLDDFKAVFENAESSAFLKGSNNRNWSANFDWLIKDSNMAKVLEGNYNDKPKGGRREVVPGWMEQEDDSARLAEMLTAGNSPDIAARAEQLRKELNR